MTKAKMEDTKVEDLELRFGYPYVYIHQVRRKEDPRDRVSFKEARPSCPLGSPRALGDVHGRQAVLPPGPPVGQKLSVRQERRQLPHQNVQRVRKEVREMVHHEQRKGTVSVWT
jgi:hypothetical protein